MKRLVILSACLAISLAGWAQGNRNDSLRMDSIIHSLPDVMVKGNRPIVKVKGATLTYDLPQLIKNHPVDNAYEAIKQLPGVSEQDEALTLNAQSVTVMIDGKTSTMTSEQLYSLLKTIPTSRIANAEVVYSAPSPLSGKGTSHQPPAEAQHRLSLPARRVLRRLHPPEPQQLHRAHLLALHQQEMGNRHALFLRSWQEILLL